MKHIVNYLEIVINLGLDKYEGFLLKLLLKLFR